MKVDFARVQRLGLAVDSVTTPANLRKIAIVVAIFVTVPIYITMLSMGQVASREALLATSGILLCVLFTLRDQNDSAVWALFVLLTASFVSSLFRSTTHFYLSLFCQMGLTIILINLFEFGRVRLMIFVIWMMTMGGLAYHAWYASAMHDGTSAFITTVSVVAVTLGTAIFSQGRIRSTVDLLQTANAELVAEARANQEIIRALPGCVLITSFSYDPQIRWCNAEVPQVLKVPKAQLLGQPLSNFGVDHKTAARLLDQLQQNEVVNDFYGSTRDAMGGTHALSGNIRTIDYEGQPALLWMLEDISALQEAEQIIRRTQRMDHLGVLAGKVTHDFNNMLSIINLSMGVGAAKLEPDHPSRAYFMQASNAVEEAAALVAEMRGYAQLGKLVTERVDASLFLQGTADKLRGSTPANIAFRPNLHAALPPINIDSRKMERVLLNLILNAFDAIGDRSGTVRLNSAEVYLTQGDIKQLRSCQHDCLEPGAYIKVDVVDDGQGMSPELTQRIFEPFFTTKEEGSGLGLAAVQGIVEKHRGGISVTSTLGEGTTFTLLLPTAA